MLNERQEVITLLLIGLCYTLWIMLLALVGDWTSVLILLGLSVMIAFHSSLQHEIIHSHPFKNQRLNEALVYLPIGLTIPYHRFRDLHLEHHNDAILTDPYDDPETNYLDPEVWSTLSKPAQLAFRFNNTLIGRMVIGPALGLFVFYRADARAILNGNKAVRDAWLHFFVGAMIVIGTLAVMGVPIWFYLAACYMALSLLKVRTFLEHQAHERAPARSVVIEDRGPFALLYLNNCYHSVHHIHPKVPWYALPKKYRDNREEYLKRNNHYVYKNYLQIFREYFWQRKDDVPHPLYRREK